MLRSVLVATAALTAFSSFARADAPGQAIVNNGCSYDVYLQNVPGGGSNGTEVDKTLTAGSTYTQTWTPLDIPAGWSMKLSKADGSSNIMQYEYSVNFTDPTWGNTIFFDLSDVNGNPWNGNWMLSSNMQSCSSQLKQNAYRYSTDDAYGMQSCNVGASVTVTLCSGDNAGAASSAGASGGGSGGAPPASSWASSSTHAAAPPAQSPTTQAPPAESPTSPTTQAPAAPTSSTTGHGGYGGGSYGGGGYTRPTGANEAVAVPQSSSTVNPVNEADVAPASPSATTFMTSSTAYNVEGGPYGATITEVETVIATAIVTATEGAPPQKREADLHRHQHHARHPHGRL